MDLKNVEVMEHINSSSNAVYLVYFQILLYSGISFGSYTSIDQ
jgi:hypothetical protein